MPINTTDWGELENLITDTLADSLDADWTCRTGAQYVVEALKLREQEARNNRVCGVCGAIGQADHAGFCSESW